MSNISTCAFGEEKLYYVRRTQAGEGQNRSQKISTFGSKRLHCLDHLRFFITTVLKYDLAPNDSAVL